MRELKFYPETPDELQEAIETMMDRLISESTSLGYKQVKSKYVDIFHRMFTGTFIRIIDDLALDSKFKRLDKDFLLDAMSKNR